LLAALNATGTSHIGQSSLTRDHSEKMLAAFGANLTVSPRAEGGEVISIQGPAKLTGCSVEVPRDPSSAAFPLISALIVPGSEIELPAILLNPRRTGLIETLLEMGAKIDITNRRTSGGEEIGDLIVRHSEPKGVEVPAARAPSMITNTLSCPWPRPLPAAPPPCGVWKNSGSRKATGWKPWRVGSPS